MLTRLGVSLLFHIGVVTANSSSEKVTAINRSEKVTAINRSEKVTAGVEVNPKYEVFDMITGRLTQGIEHDLHYSSKGKEYYNSFILTFQEEEGKGKSLIQRRCILSPHHSVVILSNAKLSNAKLSNAKLSNVDKVDDKLDDFLKDRCKVKTSTNCNRFSTLHLSKADELNMKRYKCSSSDNKTYMDLYTLKNKDNMKLETGIYELDDDSTDVNCVIGVRGVYDLYKVFTNKKTFYV
eukprot:GHVR01115970.1.p1 GENE.GHVR01115970.1~~GHVR01115970.1.p1  ORF type:complete len:237 (+),score=32.61 GHVR01115970.1:48-758(+)